MSSSSHKFCPTSAIKSSPVARSNAKRHGLRSPVAQISGRASAAPTKGLSGGIAYGSPRSTSMRSSLPSKVRLFCNLTDQVRNIADVTIAVASGDLSKKITVDVRGEILQLKEAINTMVDQLNAFAAEVTRVAREVGTDGNLGGQALVPGVAGTWKDLT